MGQIIANLALHLLSPAGIVIFLVVLVVIGFIIHKKG